MSKGYASASSRSRYAKIRSAARRLLITSTSRSAAMPVWNQEYPWPAIQQSTFCLPDGEIQ